MPSVLQPLSTIQWRRCKRVGRRPHAGERSGRASAVAAAAGWYHDCLIACLLECLRGGTSKKTRACADCMIVCMLHACMIAHMIA
eukprot:4794014-Prymnesium_polylepis.1